jgi:hypothetical protein
VFASFFDIHSAPGALIQVRLVLAQMGVNRGIPTFPPFYTFIDRNHI